MNDMWNVIDFVTNSLYVATVALRVVSYFQVFIICIVAKFFLFFFISITLTRIENVLE